MANYIRYANQGATRSLPLSDDLLKRLAYLESMGITAEVFSGGQPGKGSGLARVGSTRHDHGGAGDMRFYQGDKRLSWANPEDRPIFEEIVRKGKEAGITGFGAGPCYMGEGTMHVGMGTPGVWGAGGKGDNAPGWLRDAYYGTSGSPDPTGTLIAESSERKPLPSFGALMSAKAENRPYDPIADVIAAKAGTDPTSEQPKSHNGVLVEAYNKLTGNDVQVPDTIGGVETDKVMGAFSGLGDLAKAMNEETDNLNRQIQAASAGPGRGSSAPVEIKFVSAERPALKRKRRGGLGGIGGILI